MLNLSTILENSARKYPNSMAFTFMDKSMTYGQINTAANQVANGLVEFGIKQGDKVALSCLNIPYFPIIYFGILKAGAIVVPLSVLLKGDEIAYHLGDSDAKAYFCFEGTPELPMAKNGINGFNQVATCEHFILIPASPDGSSSKEGMKTFNRLIEGQPYTFETNQTKATDTALIIYTSGTTGKPKGAELTHSNLLLNTVVCRGLLDTRHEDTQLLVLPLFHIFSMVVLMTTGVYVGAGHVLLPRFEPKAVYDLIIKHKISVFAGVPSMYWGLLSALDDSIDTKQIAKNLRIAGSGGASLPMSILNDFKDKFGVSIIEGYGMSEGSPVITFNQVDVGQKVGSIGTPVWGVEVKLVDENDNEVPVGEKGELIYRGHNVMKGYYNKPEATAKTIRNGWLYSGDIAIKDEDGFFYIVDRSKDMIIRGGLNVYPREIEEVMIKHEAVSLVAIIGIPDINRGEEIKAYVVLNKGMEVSESELKEWTKSKVADYKYPRIIEFTEGLPMSATGKILKKELRKA